MMIFSKALNVCAMDFRLLCSFHFFAVHARFSFLIATRFPLQLILFLLFRQKSPKLTVMLTKAERIVLSEKNTCRNDEALKNCYVIHATIHLFLMTVIL